MKKSEIKVTMPLSTFEEFTRCKTLYDDLKRNLADCYDLSLFTFNKAEPIRFDSVKAEKIAHSYLASNAKDATVIF